MLKLIAVLACLLPFSAFANTYELSGPGSCSTYSQEAGLQYLSCSAKLRFHIDPADYGAKVRLYETSGLDLYVEGDFYRNYQVLWFEWEPGWGSCIEICAHATTDLAGNLTGLDFIYIDQISPVPYGDLTNWGIDYWQLFETGGLTPANGTWTVSTVPLPPSSALFAAALLLIPLLRLARSDQQEY